MAESTKRIITALGRELETVKDSNQELAEKISYDIKKYENLHKRYTADWERKFGNIKKVRWIYEVGYLAYQKWGCDAFTSAEARQFSIKLDKAKLNGSESSRSVYCWHIELFRMGLIERKPLIKQTTFQYRFSEKDGEILKRIHEMPKDTFHREINTYFESQRIDEEIEDIEKGKESKRFKELQKRQEELKKLMENSKITQKQ